VRHLVARDASAALAELDATIQSGVEIGLLLDQLVGYFRDVMTTVVGCGPDQMLYALPSQSGEVAEIGRQLGLATVLAIGQILDHTAARLRVSMHARTLVEMAMVRICQIGEMEDLASLVAELRGTAGAMATTTVASETRMSGSLQAGFRAEVDLKKNDEPRAMTPSLATSNTTSQRSEQMIRREDAAHESEMPAIDANGLSESPVERESVLAQFKQAMANGGVPKAEVAPPRVSRREQLAQVAEQPLVRRAMELFDVAPDKMRYTPPNIEPK
jgi:DNA polymerase III gamma/tau subunit